MVIPAPSTPSGSRRVRITERDRLLLSFAAEQRLVLAEHIGALLGIDPRPLPYVGRNLLAGLEAPVVRPYGDWLDAHHLFLTHPADAVCYDLRRRAAVPAADCSETDRSARAARQVSRLVVTEDLQQRLRDRMQPQ